MSAGPPIDAARQPRWEMSARRYDDYFDAAGAHGYVLRARMAAVLGLLAGRKPGDLLDAGMGPGRLCAELHVRGWAVSGVDYSPEMVELAGLRLPEVRERLLVARIEALPFPPESFDAVLATGVLEYADMPAALGELARVLRPGGLAIVSYPNPDAVYSILKTRAYYPLVRLVKLLLRRPDRKRPRGHGPVHGNELERLLRAAGLVPMTRIPSGYQLVPAPLDSALAGIAEAAGRTLERRAPRGWRRLSTQLVYAASKPERPLSELQAGVAPKRENVLS